MVTDPGGVDPDPTFEKKKLYHDPQKNNPNPNFDLTKFTQTKYN